MLGNLGRNNRLIMAGVFTWSLSTGLWYNQRQLYLSELGASPEQIGTALALEFLLGAFVQIPAGFLSDRIGPRRVIIIGRWFGIAGALVMALAQTWQLVTLGLVIHRLCAIAYPPMIVFVLLSLADQGKSNSSAKTLTTVFSAWPAAQLIAPMLGGIIAEKAGIQTDLWIGTATFVVSLGFFLLTRDVPVANDEGTGSAASLIRNRPFLVSVGFYALATVTLYVGYTLAPNFLQEVRGFSLATIGLFFSILAVGSLVSNFFAGRIPLQWSLAGLLVLPWLALFSLWQSNSPLLAGMAFFMLGCIATTWTVMNASIAQVVELKNQGQAFGIMGALMNVATGVASWLAGYLYTWTPGHDLPLIAGLVSIPIIVAIWFLFRLGRASTQVSPPANERIRVPPSLID